MFRVHREGFTLVEILIVVGIIALLAAIAIPNVLRGRTTANEAAAVGNLRALVNALEMERSVNHVYPLDVAANTWQLVMYGVDCDPVTAPAPDFGPPSFCSTATAMTAASPTRVQGYDYAYTEGSAAGQTYVLLARPGTVGTVGTRSFLADQSGLLRHCVETGGVPAATSGGMANNNTIDQPPTIPCT